MSILEDKKEIKPIKKKSKYAKYILIATIAVVVLAGIFIVLTITKPKTDDNTSESSVVETGIKPLIDLETTKIKQITIKIGEESYNIKSTGENAWGIPQLGRAPINSTTLATTANAFASIIPSNDIGEVENLSEYGLDKPKSEVTIEHEGGSVSFTVGNQDPTKSGYYVAQTADNKTNVYLISNNVAENAIKSKYQYVDKSLVESMDNNDPPTITEISIQRKGKDTIVLNNIVKDEDDDTPSSFNTHKIVSPVQVDADVERAKYVIYGMYGLTANDVLHTDLDEVDMVLAGLDNPTAVVEMKTSKGNYKLTIGNPIYKMDEDGKETKDIQGYFGVFDGVDVLYAFAPTSLPWVDVELDAIMSRRPLMPYIYLVDYVELSARGVSYSVRIIGDADENSAKLDGKEVDMAYFKQFYQYLLSLPGEELYFEAPTGEKIAEFTYKYRDKSQPDDKVEIYQSEDRKIIVQINGKPLFKTRQLYGTRLADNIVAFKEGKDIVSDW